MLKHKIRTTGSDMAMVRQYSSTKSFVSFPPLVITKNENHISTIQKRRPL